MTTEATAGPSRVTIERTYDASAEHVWELMTTASGIEEWWAPEGFETKVTELELAPGGHVRYILTAAGPEQVAFVQSLGMPLSNEFVRTFTEVKPSARLAYTSVIDFVPDCDPYEHLTTIDLVRAGGSTTVVMTLDPLHDEAWTRDYRDHREHELGNIEAATSRPRA